MSEILHSHNILQTLEYLALGTLSRILNTTIVFYGWFLSNECITSLYQVYVSTVRSKKIAICILLLSSSFFSRPNAIVSYLLTLVYIYKSAPFSSTQCSVPTNVFSVPPVYLTPFRRHTKILISVPCTTPYFHKDTLTPPSSSRSTPLEGGGPSMYAARDASLYNAHPLLRCLHHTP